MVQRKSVFNDGHATYEMNYKDHSIKIRACGFLIIIKQPKNVKDLSTEHIIKMSANSSVELSLNELNYLNKCITYGIEIINSTDWSKQLDKVGAIPYKDIVNTGIYADATGHRWIYLGEGFLYEKCVSGNWSLANRASLNNNYVKYCKHIYIDYEAMTSEGYSLDFNKIMMDRGGSRVIDSYTCRKKFVNKCGQLPDKIDTIVTPYNVVKFRENDIINNVAYNDTGHIMALLYM